MTEADKKHDKSNTAGVAEHLTGNRKKRKNYIIVALNPMFSDDIKDAIMAHLRNTYPQYSIAQPKNEADLAKQFIRQISLVIIDDSFCSSMDSTINAIKKLKEQKHESVFPTLFLTDDQKNLVNHYNKSMLAYHELDDYLVYTEAPIAQIYNRLKAALEMASKRRSRRYKVEMTANLFILGNDKPIPIKILDLSIHGALISAEAYVFKIKEQVRLQINTSKYIMHDDGEFIRLSAKVRRVFIGGNVVGVSFEYMTEKQVVILTKLVAKIGNLLVLGK